MRTRFRTAGAAALLGLGLVLTGCSSQAADDASSGTGTDAPGTSPSPSSGGSSGGSSPGTSRGSRGQGPAGTPAYEQYVAMGDSYTAAPLVPPTDTSNGCLRSASNYPSLVAAALPGVELTDVSCSGADSTSLVGAQQTRTGPQPAQFDALGEDTDLVTIGIGGNDGNLFGTLVGTCSQLRDTDPAGSPCRDELTRGGTDRLRGTLREIRSHVAAIVTGIRDRAPGATVVVVGYPQIVPDRGTCPELPLAAGDYAYGRALNRGLADAVERGARRADAYVDVYAASAGHDICAEDPWVNGIRTDPARALAFHPFAAEQRAVADLVLDAL